MAQSPQEMEDVMLVPQWKDMACRCDLPLGWRVLTGTGWLFLRKRKTEDLREQDERRKSRHHTDTAAAAATSLQSCPTLCDPIDSSPPGSPVPGILKARTLEWVAISFSNAWKWKVKVKSLGRVQLLATSWTAAYQTPASMGFSRQEYWSGVPLPSPKLMQRCTILE